MTTSLHAASIRRRGLVAVSVIAVLALTACSGRSAAHPPPTPTRRGPLVVQARVAPWHLPVPLSRSVALRDGHGLLVAGGLTATSATTARVTQIDPRTGVARAAGSLADPVHDAAGAVFGHRDVVFGGGSATTVATVQALTPGGLGGVAGGLPRPRSDLAAASVGDATFLVGGYDGSTLDPAVLKTTDGRQFTTVAQLPAPVRYPAVGVLGRDLYAFGGESAHGVLSDSIQRLDPRTGTATVIGHLPQPLSQAATLLLGGSLYVVGGRTAGGVSSAILRFDPTTNTTRAVGELPYPVAAAGATVVDDVGYLVGGETPDTTGNVIDVRLVRQAPPATSATPARSTAPVLSDSHPFDGQLLIADRGNNRLLVVDAAKHILWSYPSADRPAPPGGFYFPDDAFFTGHGTGIITNEEDNNAIVRIAYPSGQLLWSYGHPRTPGHTPGYLDQPDDAYLLADGQVTVADAMNCRVLLINPDKTIAGQIGTTGRCVHAPPRAVGYPNGDTPLPDGTLLISEIDGSWVSDYTRTGQLNWTVHLPITYPSDPQQIGPDRYLIADYAKPGGLYEFDRAGHILWSYHPASGTGMLNHPSLAEPLPGGFIAVNDDYRDRVVIIDPHSRRIVWQYGETDTPGTAPGLLNTPDGFDLLAPDRTTPTHPNTG